MESELKKYLKNLKQHGKSITNSEYRDEFGEVKQEVRDMAIHAHYIEHNSSSESILITNYGLEQLGVSGWFEHNFKIITTLLLLISVILSYLGIGHN